MELLKNSSNDKSSIDHQSEVNLSSFFDFKLRMESKTSPYGTNAE